MDLFKTPDSENFERLKRLSAIDAVRAYLNGDFSMGEEDALILAIRNGTNTCLSDDEINELLLDAMDAEESAEECLSKIVEPQN